MRLVTHKNHIILLTAILIVVALLYLFSALQTEFLKYVGFLSDVLSAHRIFGVVIFIVISMFSAIASPFSSIPLVPSAVAVWGGALTFVFLMTGWILGGWVAYFVGRLTGKNILYRYGLFEKVDYYKNKFSSRTQFSIVLLFRLAIPSEVAGYTLGIAGYDFRKYLLVTLIAEVPFAIVTIYSSKFLVAGEFLIFSIIVSLIMLAIIFLSRIFHRKLK